LEKSTTKLVTPAFLIITAAAFAYFTSVGIVLPVLSRFVKGPLHGNNFSVGLVTGAFSFSAVLLRPFAGRVGDRRGRKLLVATGAALASVAVAGYTGATAIGLLIALRLLNGTGEAFFFTGSMTAINDLAPEDRRGEAVSFFTVSVYSGLALGPFLGESILVHWGFHAVWWTSAVLALAAAVVALKMPDTRPAAEVVATTADDLPIPPRKRGLVHRGGLIPGVVLASSVWGFTGLSSFGPLYALQAGLSGSRLLFGLYALTILLIRVLGARVPDRLGFRRTTTISLFVSAAGLLIMGARALPIALYTGVFLFAVGQALAFPSLISLVAGRVPAAERGAAIATFTAFLDIAFGFGPLTLGVVAQGFGYQAVFLTSALFAVGGIVLLATVGSPKGKEVTA